MREQRPEAFTAAEADVAARLRRWSNIAVVPIDAAAIAARAATAPRVRQAAVARAWSGSRGMAIGLAALLVLALTFVLAAAGRQQHPRLQGNQAVVLRPTAGGVDVVLADATGRERLLRQVTPGGLGIDPRYVLGAAILGQSVSQQGWLELRAAVPEGDRAGLAPYGLEVLVDLADPARAPIVVLGNGFMSGQWGPDGSWAYYCAAMFGPRLGGTAGPVTDPAGLPDCGMPPTYSRLSGGAVRVVRPDAGISAAIIVPHVETFGGGPKFIWAADGSGFIARDPALDASAPDGWGITPLDGGPFRPGNPKFFWRETDIIPSRPDLDHPETWAMPADHPLAGGALVSERGVVAADGTAVWQLLDNPAAGRVVLVRLSGPRTVDSARAFQLPETPAWLSLAPDDTSVAIVFAGADADRFVLASIGDEVETISPGPTISGVVAGLVPGANADAWPSR